METRVKTFANRTQANNAAERTGGTVVEPRFYGRAYMVRLADGSLLCHDEVIPAKKKAAPVFATRPTKSYTVGKKVTA